MRRFEDESGIVVIVALVLLATLTLIGATAFFSASHNVRASGNYRTGETALQVAMAGVEQPRETLRAANAASSNPTNFSEELLARVGANGVLNGYTSSTDDSPIASSSTLISGYNYSAYLTNDSSEGASNTTDSNGNSATAVINQTAPIDITLDFGYYSPGLCAYNETFWKANPSKWPVTTLTLGGKSYTQAELIAILGMATNSYDDSVALARELIAAGGEFQRA